MKIVFYEPQCKGIEHNKFISSTIRMVQRIFPDAEFVLFAESELCENLSKEFVFKQIITFTLPGLTNSRLRNVRISLNFEKNNIKKIKQIGCDKLICLSVSMYTIFEISKSLKNIPVYAFFHGILESLTQKYRPYNMLYWVKPILQHESSNIHNIVLGDCIKNNLIEKIPSLTRSTVSVDHVYPCIINEIKPMNEKIRFAGIGFGLKEKGSDFIFELSEKFSEKAEFVHIGKMDNGLVPEKTNVRIPAKDTPLSTQEFDQMVDSIDYGLYFYDLEKYKLTASGAIFDALTHGKPVICLCTTYFEYIFKKLGSVGYLCDSKEEMISVVRSIIEEHDELKYLEQQKTIEANIWKFSEDEIQKRLKEILR